MAIACQAFSDFLSRKAEHLQDWLLRDVTPSSMLIGQVETGRWSAEDGVTHTFDKFKRVMPDMSHAWADVTAGSCIGAPCDPDVQLIGMGFDRDMSKLQRTAYETDLICYDQVLSADRAKRQWAHVVDTLRDATKFINDNRIRVNQFRFAGHHWLCMLGGLEAFTFTETGDLIEVTPTGQVTGAHLPTSKLVVNMLKQRIEYQKLNGYFEKVVSGNPLEVEVHTDMDTIWELVQGDSASADHWRFDKFDTGSVEYHKYGWTARVGNFMLHADIHPIRFELNAAGTGLTRVFPYVNIPATVGIKGVVNPKYITAPVQAHFIWHRRGIRVLMRDNTAINPNMPFAARDFGGKWQFLMDNLTCGSVNVVNQATGQVETLLRPVDNSLRNKGKFHADFQNAIEPQFPEYVEVFLALREPPCIVGKPPCSYDDDYVPQDYSSDNAPCD